MKCQFIKIALLLLCASRAIYAEETTPPEKAVPETSKTEGFKLSSKAMERIGVKFSRLNSAEALTVPFDSLVYSLDQIGVYRLRVGWIKFVTVKLLNKSGLQARVQSAELKPQDQIATQGVALLRASEMEAFGGGE